MLGGETLLGKGFSVLLLLLLGDSVGCFMWSSAVGKEWDDGLSLLCVSGSTGWGLRRSIMPVIDAKRLSAPCNDAAKTATPALDFYHLSRSFQNSTGPCCCERIPKRLWTKYSGRSPQEVLLGALLSEKDVIMFRILCGSLYKATEIWEFWYWPRTSVL